MLKSLDLFGFKSFADRTRFEFAPGVTCVVSPNVFEEAAGISRSKARRVEAQRKRERVGQNLLRLTDIVSEVESQLLALRSQAAKAAKFREYSQELRALRIGSAADDYRTLRARLEAIDRQRHNLSAEIGQAAREARECESH